MNASSHIVPPLPAAPGEYEVELARRLNGLLAERAAELAKLGWLARRRRERELQRWVEAELSTLVRAGKLPAPRRRGFWAAMLEGGTGPVIH